jgi:hypothetical protein
MSNLTLFTQQVDDSDEYISLGTGQLTELGESVRPSYTSRQIRFKNGAFSRFVNGEQIGKSLHNSINVVIVGMTPNAGREYYADAYDPSNKTPKPPACWSLDGVTPHESIHVPQASSCKSCPNSIKGSDATGTSTSCKYRRQLSVLLAEDHSGEMWSLNLASQSMFGESTSNNKPFEAYVKNLVALGASPDQVVTQIHPTERKGSACVEFSALRPLKKTEYAVVTAVQETGEPKRNAYREGLVNVAKREQAKLAAPAQTKTIAAPATQSDDASPWGGEEPVAEPTVKAVKTTKTAPATSNAASFVESDW